MEEEEEMEDDDVILPDDFPVPPSPNITETPPPDPTWPTPSGITEQQATDVCQRVLESYAAFRICREYVNLESVIRPCVDNVQVRRNTMIYFLSTKIEPLSKS